MTFEPNYVLLKKIAGAVFVSVAVLLNLFILTFHEAPNPEHVIGGIAVGAILMVLALPLYLWAEE